MVIDVFGAMAAFVALKAFQQRNVAFDSPALWVLGISMLMAFTEVYVIATIVRVGYDPITVIAIGLGAGVGALIGRGLHRKVQH